MEGGKDYTAAGVSLPTPLIASNKVQESVECFGKSESMGSKATKATDAYFTTKVHHIVAPFLLPGNTEKKKCTSSRWVVGGTIFMVKKWK